MTLKHKLKVMIVEGLQLPDIQPDDILDDDLLFGDKFGLDSIDSVEMVYQVNRHFGIEIKNMNEGRIALESINSLAAFIEERKAAA